MIRSNKKPHYSIKAIGFDIGHTLVHYKNPLNWKASYLPALRQVIVACGFDNVCMDNAICILLKYNTRESPRTAEFSADVIFGEILSVWQKDLSFLPIAKNVFFAYFQNDASLYPDVIEALNALKQKGLKLGALTDVAYGMDREVALQDIVSIEKHFDTILTSVDVGYRKPHSAGYLQLCKALSVESHELMYVGDEKKDIEGANAAMCASTLINRAATTVNFNQDYTINTLKELLELPI